MLDRVLNYILERFGFKTPAKRSAEESVDDISERCSKQRKIEHTEEQPFITSNQFACPSSNWKMPRKKSVTSCRQQQRMCAQSSLAESQPGCSWSDESKENIIEVSDDEEPDIIGSWQDANTLRKQPIYSGRGRKKTNISNASNKHTDNDIEVVKVVPSHKEEMEKAGNSYQIFQTPRESHLRMDSSNSRKPSVLYQRLRSSKFSQGSDGSQSSSSCRSSVNRNSKLALNESFRLQEKYQYSELLQKFTNVDLHTPSAPLKGVWGPSFRTVQEKDASFKFEFPETKKMIKTDTPILIDLTKSRLRKSVASGKRIELRKDKEKAPYTSATKQDEGQELQVPDIPVVRSNTLADGLKSNYFCCKDLVSSINDKYSRKKELMESQAETEKVKATHFQKRDKKLKMEALERMTDYLKITDAIMEDDVIFEEDKTELPELTPEMEKIINNALIPKPATEVLVDAFGLPIKRHDMQTLSGLNWLNDEVINFYMELLKERGKLENYPSVYSFNTFFYPRLISGGHSVLKRWTRKVDIFSHDILIVPVHLGVHWCMSAINLKNKTIKYYDSMGSPNNKCLQSLLKYLEAESLDKKKIPFNTTGWQLENIQKIPQQMNGSDCGMFSCMYAEFICRNAEITFSQQDMPYFRRKMVYEICTKKLLL